MSNLRDIKRRIRSVKNTGKITRAMQLVAASKMKRAQEAAVMARPYAQMLAEMLSAMPRNAEGDIESGDNAFLTPRPVKTRGILVLSTDRGLAGALNSNLFRFISAELPGDDIKFVAVGRKGAQFLARTDRKLIAQFSIADKAPYREVRPVVEALVQAYINGEIDTIEVLFPRFVNNLRQDVTLEPITPIPDLNLFIEKHKGQRDETAEAPIPNDTREMLFEPSKAAILDQIVDLYIRREIRQRILEAQASEQSARMVAMKTATDNAHDLEQRLTLNYNKARQAAITQELVELSAASAAAKQ
jgi:F-type H+-transporting ATPase subunit gamma